MGKNIRSSSSPKALATSFPMPPLADAMDAVRLSVDRFCLLAGVEALAEMMEEDATTVCGARHRRHGNRRGYRWGHTQSEIGYHGGRVKVQRPRVRDHAGKEVGLESWQVLRDGNLLLEWALNLMVLNVSTRKYHRAVRLPEGDLAKARGDGTSKSAVSRRFVALSRKKMKAWLASDLSELDLLVIQIDGLHVGDHVLAAAIGVDGNGDKHVLAVVEGATENTVVVQALLDNLLARGLDPTLPRLFIVDGAKALSKAIRNTFGVAAAIQRCQVHKGRNIIERLPLHLHASVKKALRQAWDQDDADKAERLLRNLARRLEHEEPGVSGSILEGLDEILTVIRVNGGAKRDHRGGVRRDHLAAAGLSPSPWEGPGCDAACPQQADAAARAGGTCGPTGSSVGWVVGSVRRRGLTPAALVEPVALAIHLEDVDVVGEAVEESAGKPLGAEHLGPFVERQIGGDQGRAPLVALAEHLEQELGTGLGQRHEAEFVDDQKLVGGELLLEPQQLLVIAGLDELVDQCGGGDEADREALLAGRQAETEGDVGLAGAAVAERDEVLAALDVLAAGQLQDQRLVERGDDLEVEAIEALDHGEARRLDAPLDHAALAVDQLELGKTQKIANVVDAFRGTLPGDLVVLPQERRQLQPLEVVDEQHLPCVGHAPSPDSRLMYDLADVVATRARGRYG